MNQVSVLASKALAYAGLALALYCLMLGVLDRLRIYPFPLGEKTLSVREKFFSKLKNKRRKPGLLSCRLLAGHFAIVVINHGGDSLTHFLITYWSGILAGICYLAMYFFSFPQWTKKLSIKKAHVPLHRRWWMYISLCPTALHMFYMAEQSYGGIVSSVMLGVFASLGTLLLGSWLWFWNITNRSFP
jgi:hypothetical protein